VTTTTTLTPAEALGLLDEVLDLALIRRKLGDPEEGRAWTATQLDAVELAYRQFLALKMAYPDRDIVPTKAIDEFWHYHILDTAKYARDCERLFGCMLDHYPYFGLDGMGEDNSPAALQRAFTDTLALWDHHFGTRPPGPADSGVARCRTQCKPVKCK
jgi:hypothetical protein